MPEKKRNQNKKTDKLSAPYIRMYHILSAGVFLSVLTIILSLTAAFYPDGIPGAAASIRKSALRFAAFAAEQWGEFILTLDPPEPQEPPVNDETAAPDIAPLTISDINGDTADLGAEFPPGSPDQTYIVMLDTAAGPMIYFNQNDSRWKDYLYGGRDPMSSHGCGPTATAMLVNAFSTSITPNQMADWAAANGYWAPSSGSYHSIIPGTLQAFGLSVESVGDRSATNAASLLDNGWVLVALMGRGTLARNGHFIIITRLLGDGYVSIADPNSYENSGKRWNLEQLMNELKKSYDSGGPLWAVRLD